MNSKRVEFLVKLRDGLAMASEATNEYIDSLKPPEEKTVWSPQKIVWIERTGQRGIFEQSEDFNNTEFKAMHRDIVANGGKLERDGVFYWIFQNGSTIGKKRRGLEV